VGFNLGNWLDDAATSAAHGLGVLPKSKHITGVNMKQVGDVVKTAASVTGAVVSFVPGVGTAVSAAIGAGVALASGRPIDEALVAGVKGAIPGGDAAAAAYDLGRAAVTHQSLSNAAIMAAGDAAGVQIPPQAAQVLSAGLHAATSAGKGHAADQKTVTAAVAAVPAPLRGEATSALQRGDTKALGDALTHAGQAMIPTSPGKKAAFQQGLHVGVAVQHGAAVQSSQAAQLKTLLGQIQSAGAANLDPKSSAARNSLSGKGLAGFDLGWGAMHAALTPFQLSAMRSSLSGDDQHGFDIALALKIGQDKAPSPPGVKASVAAGHAIAHGAMSAPKKLQTALVMTAASTPGGALGVQRAAVELRSLQKSLSWVDGALVGTGLAVGFFAGGWAWALAGGLAGGVADLIRRGGKL
jgi:hypothetical protein